MGHTVRRLRAESTVALTSAGVPNPDGDVAWLLAQAAGVDRRDLVTVEELTDQQAEVFEAAVVRRAAREPLQHILGVAGFRYLTLLVGPGVFVPRPETEVLAELALAEIASQRAAGIRTKLTVVDLCTGSSAIALALAIEAGQLEMYAVEADEGAAAWAARNISDHAEEIAAVQSTLELWMGQAAFALGHSPLAKLRGKIDVVTCNPPYIPDDAIPRDREVSEFDPSVALYGGPDGLDVVRQVVHVASQMLRPDGALLIEHGDAQGEDAGPLGIPELIRAHPSFAQVQDHQDLTHRPRVTTARRR